jgi:hypothetical protein
MNGIISEKAKDFYKNYEGYNTSLRVWFISFGIAGD